MDVVDSVGLMQQHEAAVIERWRQIVNETRTRLLPAHGGRLVKSLGDGMLLEFENVPMAAAVALDLQRRMPPPMPDLDAAEPRIRLRMGLHIADIVVDELDVYGVGVNLAARLATLAGPNQCVVSAQARDEIVDGLDADVEDLGDCYLKNLSEPQRAFRITPRGEAPMPAPERRESPRDLRPVVAVLPLRATPEGVDAGVVGDVLADEVTVSLARCAELQVISRLSTAAFKRQTSPAVPAGQVLQADYVISGSCHVTGDAVRLRVELSETRNADVLWADGLDASACALLAGTEPAIERILVGAAAAIIGREVRRATTLPLPNVESHALMSAAITLMHRANAAEFERAREMIEHLRDRHRTMAQPHAWLAKWHVLRVVQGWSPDPVRDGQLALDAGRRALEGDAASSLAMTMQGLVHAYLRKDFDAAADCYADALAINPNESMAMLLLGTMHAFLGDGQPAWSHTQAALRLSPLDPLRYFYLSLSASAAISDRRYDDAIELAQRSLKANRMHLSTYRALAIAQSLAGRLDDARATVERLLTLEPGFTARRFLDRYPGRERAPAYAEFLVEALRQAGLPE